MWLDDDGDEDPAPGPVPDPANRHWRHPSELAAENARAAAERAALVNPASTGRLGAGPGSILWPITVVGGSIAIAAFGVLGLYLLGNPGGEEVYAGDGADPMGAITSSLPIAARAKVEPIEESSSQLLRNDQAGTGTEDPGDRADGEARTEADADRDEDQTGQPRDDDRESGPPPAGSGDQETGPTTTTRRSDSAGDTPSGSTTTTAAPAEEPVGPAVFAISSLRGEPMASLVATENHLLTSASALAGRTRVSLRVSERWFRAQVIGVDLASDIAVLVPEDETVRRWLPLVSTTASAVRNGSPAYVGYCRFEMDAAAATASAIELESLEGGVGSGQGEQETPDESSPEVPQIGSAALPGAGCGDGAIRTTAPSSPDAKRGEQRQPPTTKPTPKPPNGWDPGADRSDDDEVSPAKANRREGGVISTVDSAGTYANHTIYDPIRTSIHRSTGVAGGPLRDDAGRITGVVIGSSDSVVSALPIDRAVAVADSLVQIQVGSPAWLGVDGSLNSTGFEVVGIHTDSPATGLLAPGDVILTVEGERLEGRDHLVYLVRESGVGRKLTLSFRRPGEGRTTVEIEIVSRPD